MCDKVQDFEHSMVEKVDLVMVCMEHSHHMPQKGANLQPSHNSLLKAQRNPSYPNLTILQNQITSLCCCGVWCDTRDMGAVMGLLTWNSHTLFGADKCDYHHSEGMQGWLAQLTGCIGLLWKGLKIPVGNTHMYCGGVKEHI